MSTTFILYGTESGNAEMAADDIAVALAEQGTEAEVVGMEDFDCARLAEVDFVVVVTSTYGEGELPETAAPFNDALLERWPALDGLRYAAFGLGDSTYETFCNGIDTLCATLDGAGATQVGPTGRHDAASGEELADSVANWTADIFVAA